jgi:hypothetical protein
MKTKTATEKPSLDTEKKTTSCQKLNGGLLTPEELAMPMGLGYRSGGMPRFDLLGGPGG